MNEAELEAYVEASIPTYAAEHQKAGNWSSEEAVERARRSFEELLPEGVATKNQSVNFITDDASGEAVGYLWFAVETKGNRTTAFVYDLLVYEEFRRRGYGRAAMEAMEMELRRRKVARVSLHVFGSNSRAIELYRDLGFEVADLIMAKELS